MQQVLESQCNPSEIAVENDPSQPDLANQSELGAVFAVALKDLEYGRQPDLTALPENLAGPMKELAETLASRPSAPI